MVFRGPSVRGPGSISPNECMARRPERRTRMGKFALQTLNTLIDRTFATGDYREGVVAENNEQVVFAFQTPYVIGATPPNDDSWGIYEAGCRNGLVLNGEANCEVSISVDAGRTWLATQKFVDGLDLTDFAKGRSQYWLRFSTSAKQLADSNLQIRTVCQANVAVLPRLKDDGTTISYEASGNSVLSMGPEMELAKSFVTDGAFGEKKVTLTATPNKPVTRIYAAAHTASGSPPDPKVRYWIEYSLDAGKNWQPIVKDWTVPRRGDEPGDFWSQSLCYGSCLLNAEPGKPIQIRFRNDGGKRYLRAEAHLIQNTGDPDPVKVTYQWTDSEGEHQKSHVFESSNQWQLATAKNVRTQWVEFEPVP